METTWEWRVRSWLINERADEAFRALSGGREDEPGNPWRRFVTWGKEAILTFLLERVSAQTVCMSMMTMAGQEQPVPTEVKAMMTDLFADESLFVGLSSVDSLVKHAAARYRHFRRRVEAKGDVTGIDDELFSLLLSAESVRDEMRAFEEQVSSLMRLAQTGQFVKQVLRLHSVLDTISTQYGIDEPQDLKEWAAALEHTRTARVAWYEKLLGTLGRNCGATADLSAELATEEQEGQVLTLLQAAVDKYADILTSAEIEVTKTAFQLVAYHSGMVIMTLPEWFVMPFEFSSTFGLSRWGNDLYTPDYQDASRFIYEANTWFGLNHPHVAKFLGACHVGGQLFIAHEKVRSLRDQLRQTEDRQQVWRRLYEVALALQYLNERGLMCSQLNLDAIHCGEYDARARLFGAGLVAIGESQTGVSLTSCKPPPIVSSEIEALCVLIVACLREFTTPSGEEEEKSAKPQLQDEDANFNATEMTIEVMPASRPEFVNDAEWVALQKMREIDGTSSTGCITRLLRAIELLKTLAGITGRHEWISELREIDRQLTTAASTISIGSLVIPSLGKSVSETLRSCHDLVGSDDDLARHVQLRLADVCRQLEKVDVQQVEVDAMKQLAAHFFSLLARLHRFLDQKSCSFSFSDDGLSQQETVSMFSFHVEMDRLLVSHGLDRSGSVHDWEPEWALLCSKHQLVQLSALIRWPTLSSQADSKAAVSLTEDGQGPVDLAEASSSNFDHEVVAHVPAERHRWFIPPTEVEFRSFDEFSRGAFGSVHHGKWFDTPVVVKRVFTDPNSLEKLRSDRAQVQSQFIREADVWFRLNHINVVKMFGACHFDRPFFVCEYASGGELTSYLKTKGREPYLIWYCLLNAALGLQYLHDSGVVHADLKANNILVGDDGVTKLTDFGLSVSARQCNAADEGGAVGAYCWKAPECLPYRKVPGQPATYASDVYSFAMVMIEVVSGAYPWGKLPDLAVVRHVKEGRIPLRPTEMGKAEWRLIQRMCCLDPAQRVTINVVVVHLTSLLQRLDMTRLQPSFQGIQQAHVPHNHIASRGGALLGLLGLASSSNKQQARYAANHVFAVHINRGKRSEKREIDALVKWLRCGSVEQKTWAARALTALAWHSPHNQALIASAGAIPAFVALIQRGNNEQKDKAAAALLNLSANADNQALIAAAGGIPALIKLVWDGSQVQKPRAAGALWNLTVDRRNHAQIIAAGGILALVTLLGSYNASDVQKERAAGALWNLSADTDNQAAIAAAGAISVLLELVRYGTDAQRKNAAGALWNLAYENPDNAAFIVKGGGLDALLAVVRCGDEDQAGKWVMRELDAQTRSAIVANGGIAALLEYLASSSWRDDKDEALVAVRDLYTDEDEYQERGSV